MVVAFTKDQEMAAHWKTQIELCEKATNRWHKRGEKIIKHFRDERDDRDVGVAKRLNLFWSNTKTKQPAIYSKLPVAVCERRFLDKDTTGRVASTILERALRYELPTCGFHGSVKRCRGDYMLVGRGQVWVRYNPKFGLAVSPQQTADDDIELNGEIVDQDEEEGVESAERQFESESLDVMHVQWKDFLTFPATARTWPEVKGVGRRLYMSRDDLIENFGEDIGKKIELDHKPKTDQHEGAESLLSGQDGMQATVYEIWWEPLKKVYFVAKSFDKLCKEVDDPLKLEKFFPCPEPWCATMTNDTLIPVPDYVESQDQYMQIDDLTKRIDILTEACKVVGVYDASAQGIKRVFQEAQEPNLIPIDSWAAFAEKGGIKGAIDWVPIETIANTLKILIEVRQQIVQDLDRTTGINDIMRGTSDARETMGAQRLKTNGAQTRLQDEQDEAARFCRDILCIMGEIVAEHFDPATLIQVSGAMYDEGLDPPDLPPPPPMPPMMGHNGGPPMGMMSPPPSQPGPGIASPPAPMPPQAGPPPGPVHPAEPAGPQSVGGPALPPGSSPQPIAAPPAGAAPMESPEQKMQRKVEMLADAITLLRNDKLRGFRIDVETDSTIAGDAEQEKQSRIQFIEGVTQFIETAGTVTAQVPEFAPLAAKMLQFAVRGFRVGRDLESAIEEFCEKAEQKAKEKASAPPQPNPEQIKLQTEQIKQQGEARSQEIEAQSEQTNAQIRLREAAVKQQGDEQRLQLDAQKMQAQFQMEMEKLRMQNEFERESHQRKMEELAANAQLQRERAAHQHKSMNEAAE